VFGAASWQSTNQHEDWDMLTQIAAVMYLVAVAGVVAFQLALIGGAPWGHLTQGAKHEGALPAKARFAAAVSIVLLAVMAGAITSAADMVPNWPVWTSWAGLGLQALTTVANWATPSNAERRLWGPVNTVMLFLALTVMASATWL
jgi:hypothetical protein